LDETLAGDVLPRRVVVRLQHALDLVEREPGVLQHLHERHATNGRRRVPTLARHPRVRGDQPTPFVVPQRRCGDTDDAGDLTDRK
jgi:hypothetical protein